MKLVENGFQGFDGTELHYRAWLSDSPVATMIMTHGLGEHSGAYTRLAEGLKDSGFNIFVWDLRGHGKSKGDRGVIGEWADYTRDLVRFVQHVKGLGAFKEPLILSAHSMGGLVLLKTLLDHGTLGAVGFTLSSPLLGIAVQVPAVKRAGAHVLARLVPKFTMANEIDYKDLTHDQAVIAEYEKDTLRHDRTSSVLYLEMVKAMSDVFARAPKIQLPSIVQQAGADVIVSPEATRKLFPLLGSPDKTWYEYDGFKHEIFNETERARVFKDLKTWLARWTQPSKSRTTAEHVR